MPTVAESGLPGYEVTIWYAVFVPAGTPRAVISRLNTDTVNALNSPDLKDRLTLQGLDVAGSTPAELDAIVKAETLKWAKVVKESGAQLE